MQTNILKKCLEELNKAEPNISYLKGTLETLIEMSGNTPTVSNGNIYLPVSNPIPLNNPSYTTTGKVDEVDEVLAKYNHGKIGNLS